MKVSKYHSNHSHTDPRTPEVSVMASWTCVHWVKEFLKVALPSLKNIPSQGQSFLLLLSSVFVRYHLPSATASATVFAGPLWISDICQLNQESPHWALLRKPSETWHFPVSLVCPSAYLSYCYDRYRQLSFMQLPLQMRTGKWYIRIQYDQPHSVEVLMELIVKFVSHWSSCWKLPSN